MPAGLSTNVTLASVNQQVGAKFQALAKALTDIQDFKTTWLDPNGAAGLLALGMVQGDVDIFFAAVQDAAKLNQIFSGQATLTGGTVTVGAGGYDFRQFIEKCIGIGVGF